MAVWWSRLEPPNEVPSIFCTWRFLTVRLGPPPNKISRTFLNALFGAKSLNLIPANISTYTVINQSLLNTNGLQRSSEYSKATNTASTPAEHNNLHRSHIGKSQQTFCLKEKRKFLKGDGKVVQTWKNAYRAHNQ